MAYIYLFIQQVNKECAFCKQDELHIHDAATIIFCKKSKEKLVVYVWFLDLKLPELIKV
jgi:hypothetical protein